MVMQAFADQQFITGPAELMSVVQSIHHHYSLLQTQMQCIDNIPFKLCLRIAYIYRESQSGANNLP